MTPMTCNMKREPVAPVFYGWITWLAICRSAMWEVSGKTAGAGDDTSGAQATKRRPQGRLFIQGRRSAGLFQGAHHGGVGLTGTADMARGDQHNIVAGDGAHDLGIGVAIQ